MKTAVQGLRSISLITAAVCAGFDHIDGEPISGFDTVPSEVYPLDPKVLYTRVTGKAS